jgi:hypothetical protein
MVVVAKQRHRAAHRHRVADLTDLQRDVEPCRCPCLDDSSALEPLEACGFRRHLVLTRQQCPCRVDAFCRCCQPPDLPGLTSRNGDPGSNDPRASGIGHDASDGPGRRLCLGQTRPKRNNKSAQKDPPNAGSHYGKHHLPFGPKRSFYTMGFELPVLYGTCTNLSIPSASQLSRQACDRGVGLLRDLRYKESRAVFLGRLVLHACGADPRSSASRATNVGFPPQTTPRNASVSVILAFRRGQSLSRTSPESIHDATPAERWPGRRGHIRLRPS